MVRSCVFGGLFAGVVLLAFGASASALSLEELETVVKQLGRQVMLQQLAAEERVRSDGDSGIKAVRLQTVGDRPYDADTHTSKHRVRHAHIYRVKFFPGKLHGECMGVGPFPFSSKKFTRSSHFCRQSGLGFAKSHTVTSEQHPMQCRTFIVHASIFVCQPQLKTKLSDGNISRFQRTSPVCNVSFPVEMQAMC